MTEPKPVSEGEAPPTVEPPLCDDCGERHWKRLPGSRPRGDDELIVSKIGDVLTVERDCRVEASPVPTERLTLDEIRTINQAAAYFDGVLFVSDKLELARKLFIVAANPSHTAPASPVDTPTDTRRLEREHYQKAEDYRRMVCKREGVEFIPKPAPASPSADPPESHT